MFYSKCRLAAGTCGVLGRRLMAENNGTITVTTEGAYGALPKSSSPKLSSDSAAPGEVPRSACVIAGSVETGSARVLGARHRDVCGARAAGRLLGVLGGRDGGPGAVLGDVSSETGSRSARFASLAYGPGRAVRFPADVARAPVPAGLTLGLAGRGCIGVQRASAAGSLRPRPSARPNRLRARTVEVVAADLTQFLMASVRSGFVFCGAVSGPR